MSAPKNRAKALQRTKMIRIGREIGKFVEIVREIPSFEN